MVIMVLSFTCHLILWIFSFLSRRHLRALAPIGRYFWQSLQRRYTGSFLFVLPKTSTGHFSRSSLKPISQTAWHDCCSAQPNRFERRLQSTAAATGHCRLRQTKAKGPSILLSAFLGGVRSHALTNVNRGVPWPFLLFLIT